MTSNTPKHCVDDIAMFSQFGLRTKKPTDNLNRWFDLLRRITLPCKQGNKKELICITSVISLCYSLHTWRSGDCYLNKEECNLNQ